MKRDLTDAYLRTLRPPASGRLEIRDGRVMGLVLRVTAAGAASWSVRARTRDGKQTRPTLGTWPAMGIQEARRAALATIANVQAGADPIEDKRAARQARKERLAQATVETRLADWIASKKSDPVAPWSIRHAAEIERLIKYDVPPALARKPLAETARADWTALVMAKRKAAPAAASNLYRALSAFLNFCEAQGWIAAPMLPRKGAAMLAPAVPSRERVLSDEDLLAVWKAADREVPKLRAFVRLLILTAARESEVAGIALGEIDLTTGRWTISAHRAKNGTAITLPLGPLGMAELQAVMPNETKPGNHRLLGRTGTSGFTGFSRLKGRIDLASGVTGWRWHDLRRTARTGMARLGVPREHAELALNHLSGRSPLERVYDRHNYAPEVIEALTVWQDHVAGLIKGKSGAH